MTPSREKGAKDLRFFNRHNGNKTKAVTTKRVGLRVVSNKLEKVSASTMEKARQAKNVLKVTDQAGIQEVPSPTLLLHASR
mmetsp:Transcript_3195/g.7012  ORF Transcript_3195/g.7012 Transcript_3195/m.7012 type:complete len:81 (+) Transcript_3195:952-1194(+)